LAIANATKYQIKRTSARASELARRRDGSALGTPKNLQLLDAKLPEMDISLDFEEREVFSPPCEQDVATEQEIVPEPETEQVQDFTARLQAAWSEEEKREWKIDMETIAERLAARLPAATRKKKKRK
jgi:broad specificity phosphatase PhoE